MGLTPGRCPGVVFVLFMLCTGAAHAQVDTLPKDTTARAPQDTAARDTSAADTAAATLPVFPRALVPGPLAGGMRYVFDADSLRLSGIYTLSDLLARVPGVYVARGGYFGQGEYALYAGRGAAALEVFWDGVPYVPMGRDSVFLDPARMPLVALERVEVLPLPGVLRVHLVTRRQPSTHATSSVGFVTGDRDLAAYPATFARRWRSGFGIGFVRDQRSVQGALNTSSSRFNEEQLWVHVEYTPTPRVGVSYQLLSTSWQRYPSGMLVDRWWFRRKDGVLRVFAAPNGDSPGPRFQAALVSTSTDGDSAVAPGTGRQVLLDATQSWGRAQASAALRLGGRRRPLDLEGRVSWSPIRPVTLGAEARHSRYQGARSARRLLAFGGLELPVGFALRVEVVRAAVLEAPLRPADTLQETLDLAWALRWERRWITLEVGGGRRDDFLPDSGPAGLATIDRLSATPRTDYTRVAGAIRPVPWLSVAGWYFHPWTGGGDFEPPHHGRVSATFFSRFLRVFPSGIFALRGEVAAESWSTAQVGGQTSGSTNLLIGATFVDYDFQMQIGDVTAFWTMRNGNAMRASYVPGLGYPKRQQYYGIRWQFRN